MASVRRSREAGAGLVGDGVSGRRLPWVLRVAVHDGCLLTYRTRQGHRAHPGGGEPVAAPSWSRVSRALSIGERATRWAGPDHVCVLSHLTVPAVWHGADSLGVSGVGTH